MDPVYNFVRTVTDPELRITTYEYDIKGNQTKIIYPSVDDQTQI